MNRTIRTVALALALAPAACLLLDGCRVRTNKDGKNKDVDIETPFGSASVKTNDAADTTAIGLSVYPGAQPVREKDNDSNNADVSMSFGSFHLGVKAAGYETMDAPDKVLAFYRHDLGRYGDVIECRDHSTIGQPTRTAEGLSCDDEAQHHSNSTHDKLELKAGSKQHQHIVSVDARNGGTRIGLVYLDMPMHFNDKGKGPE